MVWWFVVFFLPFPFLILFFFAYHCAITSSSAVLDRAFPVSPSDGFELVDVGVDGPAADGSSFRDTT